LNCTHNVDIFISQTLFLSPLSSLYINLFASSIPNRIHAEYKLMPGIPLDQCNHYQVMNNNFECLGKALTAWCKLMLHHNSTSLYHTGATANNDPTTYRDLNGRSNGCGGVRTFGRTRDQAFERLLNRSNGCTAWCKLMLHHISTPLYTKEATANNDPSTYRDLNGHSNVITISSVLDL